MVAAMSAKSATFIRSVRAISSSASVARVEGSSSANVLSSSEMRAPVGRALG